MVVGKPNLLKSQKQKRQQEEREGGNQLVIMIAKKWGLRDGRVGPKSHIIRVRERKGERENVF